MIAVELAAEWPGWMSEVVGNAPRRVLAQGEGEDCLAFAERVATYVAECARIGNALLLCNQRSDARQAIARKRLLAAVSSVPIHLGAPVDARSELVSELERLAEPLPDAEIHRGAEPSRAPRKGVPLSSVA